MPAHCLPPHLPEPPTGRTIVIGAGKASAAMAETLEQHWPASLSGMVITRYGFGRPCRHIDIIEAAHPVPDQAGLDGARRMLTLLDGLNADDLVICLLSGGGSSLLTLPAAGISLEDKQTVNRDLLRCGATISEINTVRKHLSDIKGGRLAKACAPATLQTLIISDVPGDDPSMVASGPTVGDPTTLADAKAVISKYGLDLPHSIEDHLNAETAESPKPGDSIFDHSNVSIIARASMSLEKAAQLARERGVSPIILGDDLEGESRDVGRKMAQRARATAESPVVLLSGGETTVTVTGKGAGGPNTEFLLGLARELKGNTHIFAIACDTDGIDGSEDNAGAIVTPDTLARAAALGFDADTYLTDNNVYEYFKALGDLVITGPTFTNVNDFRAILIL